MIFIENKKELYDLLEQIYRSQNGYIRDSKFLEGFRFWNFPGDEQSPGWPTIYWKKSLEKEL